MAMPELAGFNLAGGTALALQIGHRESVDLDLFGSRPFEKDEMVELVQTLGDSRLIHQTKNIMVFNIEGVKVDFVNYKYPLIREVRLVEGVRLLDLPDIAAMKLGAITGRGRKRDFIDLFFLLKRFSLDEMFGFYNAKYPDGSDFLVARSLTYFDDADTDEDQRMFEAIDWETVKNSIRNEVKKMLR
ncbi:MAG: nucleotidyl transferase AbiEii/AbiGii toxin family protein [Bacteroidales bacterium]|nr:nucleotidyl transferase AbiEii/AbiGii toxin family protein [Bacteroidales bacterium]